jgi:hypothetical protein
MSIIVTKENSKWLITWANSPVSIAAYKAIETYVRHSKDYSDSEDKRAQIKAIIDNNNFIPHIDLIQALSIRNCVNDTMVFQNHQRLMGLIDTIAAEYHNNCCIMDLSRKYGFHPLTLLRRIFEYNRVGKTTVTALFSMKPDSDALLKSEHDREQYHIAKAGDSMGSISSAQVAAYSKNAEDVFVSYIRGLGIAIKTQDDLIAEQIEQYGQCISTPDILFIDDVIINGNSVKWLDYKNYIGTPVQLTMKKMRKQVAKYNAYWGPGAMCFRRSYIETLDIGCLLLDANSLMKSLLKAD